MTVSEPDDKGKTAPIAQPSPAAPQHGQPELVPAPDPRVESVSESESHHDAAGRHPESESPSITAPPRPYTAVEPVVAVVQPAGPQERETVFVPMSVTIGDGFKFGCGFFLALVLAMLVGFVLLAALFVLTSLFGLTLPITR